eukprot:Nitzschia sp. Nitz4//scaffold206_size41850//33575//38100//NITZ4_007428-RA/size41850-snap-gene-0.6-mRNA-1//-1//CDS//3329541583//2385//frame0
MSSPSQYVPGDIVQTTLGAGVIAQCPSGDDPGSPFQVLLWRLPGKSVGTASVAYLQPDVIVKKLPAAPGMVTTKLNDPTKKQYMVHAFSASTDSFIVSPLDTPTSDANDDANATSEEQDATARLSRLSLAGQMFSNSAGQPDGALGDSSLHVTVSAADLAVAPSAKFYPLLTELMRRGDQTAAATTQFIHDTSKNEKVTKIINKATEFAQQQSPESVMEQASKPLDSITAESVEGMAGKVKEVVNEKEMNQLMGMLKDEDLTVLLQKGKERLEILLNKDIPQATELALEKTGIRVANSDEDDSLYGNAIVRSRQAALDSLQALLDQAEVDTKDLEAVRDSLGDQFHTMFDSLTQAAKSDRNLASILQTMNDQTAEWQEQTGRLMATKSASLFMEGASRIQARAANLFSKDQLQWAGEVGSKFTKAFTEGDAAVARIKSIELGEKVRDRLVEAIEVRSESLGGLDGIIAGALTTLQGAGSGTGDQVKDVLTSLQSHATSVTKDANETLIAVLAGRSEYRDVALLKVEHVLCDLESQFGDDMSPEDIAALARGEGGTAKLFEPIAKKAAKEIEKQLDAAEEAVSDPTMIEVLKQVRKIVSGELTLQAVMDDVVNILNDDDVVAAGESWMKQGEQVLDAIEGVSGNKVVDDVMQMAEKAGITKDSVMEGIEKLDVNELLDNAGNAISDEKARAKLLSDATDTALDFILRILPSMPVPPFDGVKDGLVYEVSNLSMEGFKVRKEHILVEIAGMRATKKAATSVEIQEISGPADLEIPRTDSAASADESVLEMDTEVDENVVVKATELLIIDVREISAVFNDAVWKFEQTYMPYLKGSGKFDVKMSDGAIRLVFELRRKLKEGAKPVDGQFNPSDWVPVLALHNRTCSIGEVDFSMQGGSRLAWVINKAASMFKGLLRDYVVRTILRILSDKSGWILSKMNEGLAPFWDVLLRTAKLEMEDLEEAGTEDIVSAEPVVETNLVELVWRERLPLGMNLLMNDESGQLKVVDFPRGSQARSVCESRNLDPAGFKGAAIVAVNGIRYQNDDELFEALRDPGRPKTILFELAETEDAERVKKFVEESQQGASGKKPPKQGNGQRAFATRHIVFSKPGDLGLEFANSPDNFGLVVRKFLEGDGGIVLAAARENISVGDFLTHVNGTLVVGADGTGRIKALKKLEEEGNIRPLTLTFSKPYLQHMVFEKSPGLPIPIGGPKELDLEIKKFGDDVKRITIKGFNETEGVSEKNGILLGDYLVFVNGLPVGAGCRWMAEDTMSSLDDVVAMLKSESSYPIGLTFARPFKQEETNRGWFSRTTAVEEQQIAMESSETMCVSAEEYGQLGVVLDMKGYTDIVVKDLEAVAGPFQLQLRPLVDAETDMIHLSIDAVNGEFVPSFASPQMVKSAMERSWNSDGRVEVTFCDDELKQWMQTLKDE